MQHQQATSKTCTSCSTEQPASAFFPSPTSPDGLTIRCRTCVLGGWQREQQRRAERVRKSKLRARKRERARKTEHRVRFGEA